MLQAIPIIPFFILKKWFFHLYEKKCADHNNTTHLSRAHAVDIICTFLCLASGGIEWGITVADAPDWVWIQKKNRLLWWLAVEQANLVIWMWDFFSIITYLLWTEHTTMVYTVEPPIRDPPSEMDDHSTKHTCMLQPHSNTLVYYLTSEIGAIPLH